MKLFSILLILFAVGCSSAEKREEPQMQEEVQQSGYSDIYGSPYSGLTRY